MANGECGNGYVCPVCEGNGCDDCGDVGTLPCPCEGGRAYVHDTAEQGEKCTDCGEQFGNGMDILRAAPLRAANLREPFGSGVSPVQRMGWHVGCR
ncbi:hypothetical protein ABZY58_11560 [Micromonospora tulbaghiae]|uniref:hypothetical protein n=1 Tax=Micromonospora tulbaghiae TaxID=479978 RepID=UPI0033ADB2BB